MNFCVRLWVEGNKRCGCLTDNFPNKYKESNTCKFNEFSPLHFPLFNINVSRWIKYTIGIIHYLKPLFLVNWSNQYANQTIAETRQSLAPHHTSIIIIKTHTAPHHFHIFYIFFIVEITPKILPCGHRWTKKYHHLLQFRTIYNARICFNGRPRPMVHTAHSPVTAKTGEKNLKWN